MYRHTKDCCHFKTPIRKCFVKKELVTKYVKVRFDPCIEECCKTKKPLCCTEIDCCYVPKKCYHSTGHHSYGRPCKPWYPAPKHRKNKRRR